MRISDWSSDVCSSDLVDGEPQPGRLREELLDERAVRGVPLEGHAVDVHGVAVDEDLRVDRLVVGVRVVDAVAAHQRDEGVHRFGGSGQRSEEHTSELQSLMRISYAVFFLNKKKYT